MLYFIPQETQTSSILPCGYNSKVRGHSAEVGVHNQLLLVWEPQATRRSERRTCLPSFADIAWFLSPPRHLCKLGF